ncbi:hypothetical protein LXL04_032081 [Taraxacum kok-saghyz]
MPVVIANDAVAPSSLRTMIEGLISGTIESLNDMKFVFKGNRFNTSPRIPKILNFDCLICADSTFAIASTSTLSCYY